VPACVSDGVASSFGGLLAAAAAMCSKLVALFAAAAVPYASAQVAGTGSSVNTDACVLADGPDVR
jgi:hypothetical protein